MNSDHHSNCIGVETEPAFVHPSRPTKMVAFSVGPSPSPFHHVESTGKHNLSTTWPRNSQVKPKSLEEKRMSLLGKPIQVKPYRADTRFRKVQSLIYNFLERPRGLLAPAYHIMVLLMIILCLVLSVFCTIPDFADASTNVLFNLEILMVVWLLAEYTLRIWSAGSRARFRGWRGRLLYARSPFCLLDVIVITASIAVMAIGATGQLFAATAIRGLRFFQILRVVRIDRRGGTWKLLGSVVWAHRQELITTMYIGFLGLIFSSFLVYLCEKPDVEEELALAGDKTRIRTFADALWWGVITLCTVGYGDVYPRSWMGKIVASFCALLGISFFALPAGILGSGFALKVQQQQRQKHLIRRRVPAARLIQCVWRLYASDEQSMSVATWKIHQPQPATRAPSMSVPSIMDDNIRGSFMADIREYWSGRSVRRFKQHAASSRFVSRLSRKCQKSPLRNRWDSAKRSHPQLTQSTSNDQDYLPPHLPAEGTESPNTPDFGLDSRSAATPQPSRSTTKRRHSRLTVPMSFRLQPHDRGLLVTYPRLEPPESARLETSPSRLQGKEGSTDETSLTNAPWKAAFRERLVLQQEDTEKSSCSECLLHSRGSEEAERCVLHRSKRRSLRRPSTPAVMLTAGTPEEEILFPTYGELREEHRNVIRFVRRMQYCVSRRKFREALKPYDVKDVIEQYSAGHVDMLARVKGIQHRLDMITGKGKEGSEAKPTLYTKICRMERTMYEMQRQIEMIAKVCKARSTANLTESVTDRSSEPPPSSTSSVPGEQQRRSRFASNRSLLRLHTSMDSSLEDSSIGSLQLVNFDDSEPSIV